MTQFILDLFAWGGYLGVFLLMVLENVIPPVPSEVVMGLGGIAVARGQMQVVPLMIAGTLGTVVGNYFWYAIGRHFGHEPLRPFVDRHGRWLTLDWHDVERLHRLFERHGQWIVFFFRFMPALRTMVSLPAGMAQMPHWRFMLWTAAGSAVWNAFLIWAGFYFGTNFKALDAYLGPGAVAMGVAIVAVYLWRVMTWKPRV